MLRQLASIPIAQFYIPRTDGNESKLITDAEFREMWSGHQSPQGQAPAVAFAVASRKRFFHWFLEFPEIMQRGGFDCILGNPPYLHGQKLSGTYGHSFCEWAKHEFAPCGISDLVVYFVRRMYSLIRAGGFFSVITTNSIRDGDNREDGLAQIVRCGGVISMAVRSMKWPGAANLAVCAFSIRRAATPHPKYLDGRLVERISTRFDEEDESLLGEPKQLCHAVRPAVGSYFLGDGFLLSEAVAASLCAGDPRNSEVIFPVINGDDLNGTPDQSPSRRIINFFDFDEVTAARYQEPYRIVRELVKPQREAQNREIRRRRWWQYAERAVGLYEGLRQVRCGIATSATTKYLAFARVDPRWIFTTALFVMPTDRWDLFGLMQSTLHECWARKYSGSLETRLRYSPSDCFETFAFPGDLWRTPSAALAALG
jgi:hypothetical protein